MNKLSTIFAKNFSLQQIQMAATREFHVTGINFDIVWRRDRRLPKNPTSSGPLTDLPDYSFMDGRPAPLGTRQKGRLLKQRILAEKIVEGIKELEFAKTEYQRKLHATEDERQNILDSKLKPKGKLLNKKE